MLILAGVTLSMILGENGLLNNSKSAVDKYKIAEGKEKIQLALGELLIKKGSIELSDMIEIESKDIIVKKNNDNSIFIDNDENDNEYVTAYCNKYEYHIYEAGKVMYLGEGNIILDPTSPEIKEKISANAYVTNGLQLYFDSQNNTGNGNDANATIWKDLSGNNNNGTINGATWNNNGLKFDGVDDWVAIGGMDYPNITIEVIFDADITETDESDIICNYETGGYGISIRKENLIYGSVYSEGTYQKINGNKINKDEKYKITYTTDGKESKIYVNGNMSNSTNISNGMIEMPNRKTIMILGANPVGEIEKDYYFRGTIYQVKVYDRVLTEEEVKQNYNIDKVKYNIEQSSDIIKENITFEKPQYINNKLSIEVKANVEEGYTLQTSIDGVNWTPTNNDNVTTRVVEDISNNDTVYARLWNGEEGGEATKYQLDYYICNLAQLEQFRNEVNNGNKFDGKYINLINDIDLTSITTWTPIGNASNTFKGIFNGNGHKIINLNIDNKADYQGLFGYNEGIIENLNIESGTIKGTNKVGAIVGHDVGSIMNCSNKANVDATEWHVGGICGYSSGIVQKCYNEGKCKTGSTSLGGIVGRSDGIIKTCINSGIVESSTSAVGGIVGTVADAKVSTCGNTNNITTTGCNSSKNSNIGGIVGDGSEGVSIEYCYNTGDITGQGNKVGGIIAPLKGSINYCYNTGTITAKGANSNGNSYAGGIAGESAKSGNTISYCYNLGSVACTTGTKYPGGIVGENGSGCTVSYCYTLSSKISKIAGKNNGTAGSTNKSKTDAEMKEESLVTALGGTRIWRFVSENYPKLIWETIR